jgi:hypothetical protein
VFPVSGSAVVELWREAGASSLSTAAINEGALRLSAGMPEAKM